MKIHGKESFTARQTILYSRQTSHEQVTTHTSFNLLRLQCDYVQLQMWSSE